MNKLIQTMMKNRGYSEEFLQKINTCDHLLPRNIDVMCERLKHYHDTGERIVLLTDFDMDGITAGVVGFAGLAELGFNVALYLPSTDAYGFDETDIQEIQAEYPDVKAIVTGDVGITAFKGVQYGMEHGIEMLVTDHHTPPGNASVGASVCVDPMCDIRFNTESDVPYFGQICGAHVMYLVLRYYAQHYHDDAKFMVPQIDRLRVFAGFGTVSDSMPVYYENRPLIRDAISICRLIFADGNQDVVNMIPGCDIYRRAFLGLFIMLRCFQEHKKLSDATSIDETFFGFYVAPAFNSIKRMNKNIELAYTVFFGGADAAAESMEKIFVLTEERKDEIEKSLSKMLSDSAYQPFAPYVFLTDAISGVRGLLAQRIMAMTGEPVLVVGYNGDGVLVGSGRCPTWFPFLDITADLDYVHAAGHNPAFGVRIDSEQDTDTLVAFMKYEISKRKPPEYELQYKPDFVISTIREDADTDIDIELFDDFLNELQMYHPFGQGFPEPEAQLELRASDVSSWSLMGIDKNHLKLGLPQGLVLVMFNVFNHAGALKEEQLANLDDYIAQRTNPDGTLKPFRGRLNVNIFNGIRTVQFMGLNDGHDTVNSNNAVDDIINEGVKLPGASHIESIDMDV